MKELIGDITVGQGGQVTIQPGTIIQAAPGQDSAAGGVDSQRIEIIVDQGTLVADARGDAAISFTSATNSPQAGDWWGIRIKSGTVTLGNCSVQYARDGITFEGGRTYVVDTCAFQTNSDNGVYVKAAGNFQFSDLQVSNNSGHGLSSDSGSGAIQLSGVAATFLSGAKREHSESILPLRAAGFLKNVRQRATALRPI